MAQAEFEKQLAAGIRRRRWIEGGLTLAFFAMFILCQCLREVTKQVILHEGAWFIPDWEEVNYNEAYLPFIIIGIMGTIYAGLVLVMDALSCGYRTIEKDLHYITICRGMLRTTVYVNGKEVGRTEPFSHCDVAEFRLTSRVKVTVSFSRTIWRMAHISFSDDTASVEV